MASKILVVDDDSGILEAISFILEEAGYVVSTLTKGEEIYKKIKSDKPDLILLDILLSGTDGRVTCLNLKKDPKTKRIPIVMISAHPSAAKGAKACGANDFLAKPFETSQLLMMVKSNLEKKL